MSHLTDEDLILHYYGELSDGERTAHLTSCDRCSSELAKMKTFFGIADADSPPEPPGNYETQVWNRLRWQLGRSQRSKWTRLAAQLSAAAAILVVGVLGGRFFSDSPPTAPMPKAATARPQPDTENRSQELALSYAAGQHLDRSMRLLMELGNQRAGQASDVSGERGTAENLVASNRIYRQAASQGGAEDLANLLEELEPILLELAHRPADLSADELAAIQGRIVKGELLFKLRVIATTIRERQKQIPPQSPRADNRKVL